MPNDFFKENNMPDLSLQRCFNHKQREAAARCPECGRFFCRECITEHEDRVLCTTCLENLPVRHTARTFRFRAISGLFLFFLGFTLLWIVFYYAGQGLLSLPDAFHEGTIW